MSGNIWGAIGAITSVLTLLLNIALERKRIIELLKSARGSSITVMEAIKQAVIAVAKRAWRSLLVILSIFALGTWIRDNILVQPLYATSSWTFWQYAFAIAQVVPLTLLVYILLIEPRSHVRQLEKSRDLFARHAIEATSQIPVVPIVFYENTFKCSWVSSPEIASSYFEARGFLRANTNEIANMMENAINHGTDIRRFLYLFMMWYQQALLKCKILRARLEDTWVREGVLFGGEIFPSTGEGGPTKCGNNGLQAQQSYP